MSRSPEKHTAAAAIAAPADEVFAHLTDPAKIGRWNLGAMEIRRKGGEVFEGTSLFDRSATLFEMAANPERATVVYRAGKEAGKLSLLITAQVDKSDEAEGGARVCRLTLTASRPEDMTDERWSRLCATHEVEVLLIKAQTEAATKPR